MKNLGKGKFATILILIITFILAGVAIFTAIRIYQLRQTSISPAAPSSVPHAQDVTSCSLSFTLGVSTPTSSPTSTPAETPNETPTSSPTSTPAETPSSTPTPPVGTPNSCNGTCGSNSNCQSNLVCTNGFCRNPSCTSSSSCTCTTTAPTATPLASQPELPKSGTDWPTYAGAGLGIFVVIASILLAI